LLAAAAGLAARLAFGLGYWVQEPMNRDEVEYLSLARSLAAGRGYVYDEQVSKGPVEPFGRAPGYPAFLALVGGGDPRSAQAVPASVKAAQSIAGALGVVMIALAAFRMAGRQPAMAAAAMAALFPPLVWIAGFAYSESVFWPLGLALGLIVSHALEMPRAAVGRWAFISGLATGGAVMFRAATSPFVGILSLWLIWKRQGLALAVFWLGLLVVLTLDHSQLQPSRPARGRRVRRRRDVLDGQQPDGHWRRRHGRQSGPEIATNVARATSGPHRGTARTDLLPQSFRWIREHRPPGSR
jgi:hypothetical protein